MAPQGALAPSLADEEEQMSRMAQLQQNAGVGQGPGLQMTPPVIGQSMGQGTRPTSAPLSPDQAMPGPPPPANPALQEGQAGPQQEPSLEDMDPEKGIEMGKISAEAVKTAPDDQKEAINKELEGIVGPGGLESAYKDILKRLGGEKEFDPKLDKKDWGLFMMDFGMRMMAESGKWNSTVGGAAGVAGSGALSNMMGRQDAERGRVEDYNKELRGSALDLAKLDTERTDALSDPKNILWTDKGAYNSRTGEYVKGPDGKALQPGTRPGVGNRAYASEIEFAGIRDSLIRGGMDPDKADQVAKQQAYAGAPGIARYYTDLEKEWAELKKLGTLTKIPNTDKRISNATREDRMNWMQTRINDYINLMSGNRGGALADDGTVQPGPQNEGRGTPRNWGGEPQ